MKPLDSMTKRTKIVCTIGPASEKQSTLAQMMHAGMNVCRLNMSHNTYAWHGGMVRRIRTVAKRVGEPIGVLIDLQGPKARIGGVLGDVWTLKNGARVIFTTGRGSKGKIPVGVSGFNKYAKRGAHLLLADGTIECVVEKIVGKDIHAKVILGGDLKAHKGIAIAGVSLPLPSLTAKDKRDALWAKRQDIDFVALSFVKAAKDVEVLRRLLKRPEVKIVVKIETREAVHNFDEILKSTDVVMIARGDLGLAFSPEDVPLIQKEIIEKCRRAGKPVIVATEMLASMEKNPRPTRAEASDVANAAVDHTDAVMLSGESATGQFPVEAVRTMAHILKKTEASRFDNLSLGGEVKHGSGEEESALLASILARTSQAKAIVAGSLTGHTGRLLSRFRTETVLLIGSPSLHVVRQLNLSWGIRPFLMPRLKTMDALLASLFLQAHRVGIKKGSKIVFMASRKLAPHAQSFVGVKTL